MCDDRGLQIKHRIREVQSIMRDTIGKLVIAFSSWIDAFWSNRSKAVQDVSN